MTQIDSKTLDLLRCPITKSKLELAPEKLINWINQQVGEGEILDNSGVEIDHKVSGALVNQARTFALPIRAGVVSLSANRAISLENAPKDEK